jgi:FlaA1/EpsC-like NDP-sugar epimerase
MNPREVPAESLLGRKPFQVDLASVRPNLEGRVVMVTGAAGSIGSALCREIAACGPRKLICADRNNSALNALHSEISAGTPNVETVRFLADVGDREQMRKCFATHRIEFVFHAAADKHVPQLETKVREAVANNVLALATLLDVADEHACRGFVLISSDKAVNPASVMGATKRVGELMLATRPLRTMRCVSVRFGNVIGSSGSVIPIFQEQLRLGLPLTITDASARRFFMTSSEAVALVLKAFTMGQHGDILVLDMGESVRTVDLANKLIQESGALEPAGKFKFIGLRAGEKLEEELFFADERIAATFCHEIRRVRRARGSWPVLMRQIDALRATLATEDSAAIRARLKEIVPEYGGGSVPGRSSNNQLETLEEIPPRHS